MRRALILLMALASMVANTARADTPKLADLAIENTGRAEQTMVPFTFGQPFAIGDLQRGDGLAARQADGSLIPLQLDIKATHADGSVRHAIISGILPQLPPLPPGKPLPLQLVKVAAEPTEPAAPVATVPSQLPDTRVQLRLDGQTYSASAAEALRGKQVWPWLQGKLVNEWNVSAPLRDDQGRAHPHLHVRYGVRAYAGGAVRVDVVVENDWAFQPGPRNFTYDVSISMGTRQVWQRQALTHYHHARWRKTFWWQQAPQINLRQDVAYLIHTRAVPNYDRSAFISELAQRDSIALWRGPRIEPMGNGQALPEMPTTGGRADIGLIPGWGVTWLLTMDRRAREVTLGTGDLAGSWPMHYRDQKTDRPVSLVNYPYMTLLGHASDTMNPRTRKSEAFPECQDCTSPNVPDSAHEPAFNYLPYLLTGDFYQLEELQFWAMWNTFKTNPGYRGNILGLVHQAQVRDQAWSMRNIADAAYITPDADPLKAQFLRLLDNNLSWYNAHYSDNARANTLGINIDGGIEYNNNLGIAPWMDDFFTAAIGRIAEQGFDKARPLLRYKARFPVARMTAPGYCWIFGAVYSINVRPSPFAPLFADLAQAYASTLKSNFPDAAGLPEMACGGPQMASAIKLRSGEMVGHSESGTGFPSNMQPALAYSVDGGAPDAAAAWAQFSKRAVKPDYTQGAQFAIIPRP